MGYPNQPPWTGLGSLQSDVSDIKSQLHGKVDSHEIHSINSRLDRLEHTMREISSALDELRHRCEILEENKIAVDG
jgi:flagellar biosynthesis chaperone FliJ